MKTIGLIAEFNPFHNGHAHIIDTAKSMGDSLVVILSGNFVQRGEPALINKWKRTEMCLKNGADIVIELPTVFSVSSAEYFSYGAVRLLNSIKVDKLIFGVESQDYDSLQQISNLLVEEPKQYKNSLLRHLSMGKSFANARENALSEVLSDTSIISSPNNILAIEYLKAIARLKSSIVPVMVQRLGASHHSKNIDGATASASAIRAAAWNNDFNKIKRVMPDSAYKIFIDSIKEGVAPVHYNNFSSILHYEIRTLGAKGLKNILDVSEGLENRIIKCASEAFNILDIAGLIKTKRYAYTKIQRMLLHIILKIEKQGFNAMLEAEPDCARVLGFRRSAANLLSEISSKSLPLIINAKDIKAANSTVLEKDLYSTDIYSLGYTNTAMRKPYLDMTTPIVTM